MNLFEKKHAWILGGFEYLHVDNVTANAGSGGATFATDDIGGVHYPRSKVVWGADGSVNDTSAANPLPVVQTGTPALPTGAATAAKQDTGNTSLATLAGAVTSSKVQVDVVTAPTTAVTDGGGSLTMDFAGQKTSDYDTGAGTDTVLSVGLLLPASGGAVAGGTSSNPIRIDPTGTTPQPITDNGSSLTVDSAQLPATLGQKAMAASLPVVLASDQASVPVAATLQAGTAAIGKLAANSGVDIGDVDVTSGPTGASAFQVQGTAAADAAVVGNPVVGGGRASAAAPTDMSADGDVVSSWHLRNGSQVVNLAAGGALIGATSNALDVNIKSGAGSGGTAMTDDAAFTVATTSFTPAGGVYKSTLDSVDDGDGGAFAMTAKRAQHVMLVDSSGNELSAGAQYAEDTAHVSGDLMTMAGAVRRDTAASGTSADGDIATLNVNNVGRLYATATIDAAIPAGTNNIGDVDIVTMPNVTLAAGTNTNEVVGDVAHDAAIAGNPLTIGGVASAAAPTDVSADQDAVRAWFLRNGAQAVALTAAGALIPGDATNGLKVQVATLPNVTLAAGTNTNEVVGDAAHDAAIAGNPVRIAARAMSADYTAVATGDTADILSTLLGKLVTVPWALPGATWSYAAAAGGLVNTTGVTAKAAAGAGIRNYVTKAQIINSHQTTGTEVLIRDGAAGTVLARVWAQAAGGGIECRFDPPLRGTANTLIEIAEVTTTATAGVLVNLQGFTAAE